jgi:hypothetical protein
MTVTMNITVLWDVTPYRLVDFLKTFGYVRVAPQEKQLMFNLNLLETKVRVMLRPTVSRPVNLGVNSHLGDKTRFLLLSDGCGYVNEGRLL